MDYLSHLEVVVGLALLIEDRSPQEQRSLLIISHHLDRQLNRQTVTNHHREERFWSPSRLALAAGCGGTEKCGCLAYPDQTTISSPIPIDLTTLSHEARMEEEMRGGE